MCLRRKGVLANKEKQHYFISISSDSAVKERRDEAMSVLIIRGSGTSSVSSCQLGVARVGLIPIYIGWGQLNGWASKKWLGHTTAWMIVNLLKARQNEFYLYVSLVSGSPSEAVATLPRAHSSPLARVGHSSVPNSDLGVKLLIIADNYLKLGRLFSF